MGRRDVASPDCPPLAMSNQGGLKDAQLIEVH